MTKALRGASCVAALQKPSKKPENQARGVTAFSLLFWRCCLCTLDHPVPHVFMEEARK